MFQRPEVVINTTILKAEQDVFVVVPELTRPPSNSILAAMSALIALLPLALQPSRMLASRRSVIAGTGAAFLWPEGGASAFDLPPRDGFAGAVSPYILDDPVACAKYAKMANPDKLRQQNAAVWAVGTGDAESLQAMADGGWALAEIVDSESGTTLLHRAAPGYTQCKYASRCSGRCSSWPCICI